MTPLRLTLILTLSFGLALIDRALEVKSYTSAARKSAQTICDVVALQAQGGDTRAVYDQVFSFLRKNGPDPSATVLIRSGGKEIGASLLQDEHYYFQEKCEVTNAPDYQIVSSFRAKSPFEYELVQIFAALFLMLLFIDYIFTRAVAWTKTLWFDQVLFQMRFELGLSTEKKEPGLLGRWLLQKILGPLAGIKEGISQLKSELTARQSEVLMSQLKIKTQEQEKLQADAFEKKVRLVHHDLRGPLSAMKIAASTNGEKELLPEIINAVEKIVNNLERSNSDAEIEGIEKVRVEIAEVSAQLAIDEIALSAAQHPNIKITHKYGLGRLSPVVVNSEYLRRIIVNLISNSIDAIGSEPGEITVKCSQFSGLVEISVSDNGPGVDRSLIPELFKLDVTSKANGTGFGLYFSKTCIEAWGGEVQMFSEQGLGTMVSLILPVEKMDVTFQGAELAKRSDSLVVIDDEIEQLKKHWQIKGHPSQRFFASPTDFLHWFKKDNGTHSFVVDYQMKSTLNGLDVIRAIGKDQKVYLATSAYLEKRVLELAKSHNVIIIPKLLFISPVAHLLEPAPDGQ